MPCIGYFPAPDGHQYIVFQGNHDEWLASCSEQGRGICLKEGTRVVTNGVGYFSAGIIGIIIEIIPLHPFLSGEYPVRPAVKISRSDDKNEIFADLHELDLA